MACSLRDRDGNGTQAVVRTLPGGPEGDRDALEECKSARVDYSH